MSCATDLWCDLRKAPLPLKASVAFTVTCAIRIPTSQENVRIKRDQDRKGTYRFRGVPLNPSEDLGFIVPYGLV